MITKREKKHILLIWLLFFFICSVFVVFLIFSSIIIREEDALQNNVYPHVYLDAYPIGRMTKKQVLDRYIPLARALEKVNVTVQYKKEPIATLSSSLLNIRPDVEDAFEKAYLIGRSSHAPSRLYQKIATLFGIEKYYFSTHILYDKGVVVDYAKQLQDSYSKEPKNALFRFEAGKVVNFSEEENGNEILIEQFLSAIDKKIADLKQNQTNIVVEVEQKPVAPEITLKEANEFGIEELIGEGMSNYTHSIPGRIHNVILASSKFNGVLIPKDKVFSFNETIGDISAQTGYQPAYIIKEGKTVLGDGGGVCQVSTTLFRAAMNSGLPIIEQHPHAYRVSYYENDSKPGLDATVFSPSVDLKIKNNTPSYILIQTSVDEENMLLYFRLYGKKDGRIAEISTPILYDVSAPPPDRYQDDPTLKRGVVKQVDFPAWGGKAKFDYKVTRNNEVLFEKNFLSVYKPWQAVFLVGTQD